MWYEDLTEIDYFSKVLLKKGIAVGWLEKGSPYKSGETSSNIIEKLLELNETDGVYQRLLGYHECDFCDYVNIELGSTTLLIVYKDEIYICPALTAHYIEKHNYKPPDEFIEAVLNYDHQYATEYFKAIIDKRPKKWW